MLFVAPTYNAYIMLFHVLFVVFMFAGMYISTNNINNRFAKLET